MDIINVNTVLVINFYNVEPELLFINRNKAPYKGNFAVPGGKLEVGELLRQGATRELYEETSIKANNDLQLYAILNELLYNKELNFIGHFIINYFYYPTQLNIKEISNLKNSDEGSLIWIKVTDLHKYEDKIIPSDYQIVKNLIDQFISQNQLDLTIKTSNLKVDFYDCKMQSINSDQRELLEILEWN